VDGTTKATTTTVTDKANLVTTTESADGSTPAAPGQTKDMGLITPGMEKAIVKEEATEIFVQGGEAIGEYLKDSYMSYQKLNTQFKQDEDNVVLLLEVNKSKAIYDNKKEAVKELQDEADRQDPAAAKEREAQVKAIENQIEAQKVERE
jgi:hypothetical protein